MLAEAPSELVTDISAVVPGHYWWLLPASPQGAWPGETRVWGKAGGQSCQTALALLC